MARTYTAFEREVIDSIVWQIRGYRDGAVRIRATTRILRASLRRISARSIGRSASATPESPTEVDHVVPVNVVARMLLAAADTTAPAVAATLDRYLLTAELTRDEHRDRPKQWRSAMPSGWNLGGADDHLSRYAAAGIVITPIPEESVTDEGADHGETVTPEDGDVDTDPARPNAQRFPLRVFSTFCATVDLAEEADEIRHAAAGTKRPSTVRRGLAIEFLEEENLLETFLRDWWPFGETPPGRTEMRSCKAAARRFNGDGV